MRGVDLCLSATPSHDPIAGISRVAEGLGKAVSEGVDTLRAEAGLVVAGIQGAVSAPIAAGVTWLSNATVTRYDSTDEVSNLKHDGDSATFAYKGQVKVGVAGEVPSTIQGAQAEGSGNITVRQVGGPIQPGDTVDPHDPSKQPHYEVRVSHPSRAGLYADIDPGKAAKIDNGIAKAKVGAKANATANSIEVYRFSTKQGAIRAVKALQREELNQATVGKLVDATILGGSGPVATEGYTKRPSLDSVGPVAPSGADKAFLRSHMASTTDAVGIQRPARRLRPWPGCRKGATTATPPWPPPMR